MKTTTNILIGLSLLTVGGLQAQKKAQRPNILFILADDYGWKDTSCTGSKYYETPNIDRIAANGINFTCGYAACQVSSPSRASILTGQYTPRHGITDWIGEASGTDWRKMNRASKALPAEYVQNLPLEEITLAEALRGAGYSTFFAGKWHLGDKVNPEDQGFDINIGGYWAGSPRGGYFPPYNNPKLPDGKKGEVLSERLARETVKFIDNHVKTSKKPFFAFLSFYAVHAPIQTTEARWKYFRDKAEKMGIADHGFAIDRTLPVRLHQDNPVYAGLIAQMDNGVGIVLDEIKRLGLDKNTIIVFTGDNGGVCSGDDYATSNFPLRGGKGRQWEAGFRVPLVMQVPDMKTRNIKCSVPVIGIDFYPTLLSYAGVPVPKGQVIDGVNIRPLINGGKIAARPLFWHYPHYGNQGGEPSSVVRDGDWKLIYYHEDLRCELYNLKSDPNEMKECSKANPAKTKALKKELLTWLKGIGAKMAVPDPNYNAAKEAEYQKRIETKILPQEENLRKAMLTPTWSPDSTWWESKVTVD